MGRRALAQTGIASVIHQIAMCVPIVATQRASGESYDAPSRGGGRSRP